MIHCTRSMTIDDNKQQPFLNSTFSDELVATRKPFTTNNLSPNDIGFNEFNVMDDFGSDEFEFSDDGKDALVSFPDDIGPRSSPILDRKDSMKVHTGRY